MKYVCATFSCFDQIRTNDSGCVRQVTTWQLFTGNNRNEEIVLSYQYCFIVSFSTNLSNKVSQPFNFPQSMWKKFDCSLKTFAMVVLMN